jgi:hypothetical protein
MAIEKSMIKAFLEKFKLNYSSEELQKFAKKEMKINR